MCAWSILVGWAVRVAVRKEHGAACVIAPDHLGDGVAALDELAQHDCVCELLVSFMSVCARSAQDDACDWRHLKRFQAASSTLHGHCRRCPGQPFARRWRW